jgi:hypothetical protein
MPPARKAREPRAKPKEQPKAKAPRRLPRAVLVAHVRRPR